MAGSQVQFIGRVATGAMNQGPLPWTGMTKGRVGRTADPSANARDDKKERVVVKERAVAKGPAPTTTLSFGNGPLPYNHPLLFVIPSVAEGSAVLSTLSNPSPREQ